MGSRKSTPERQTRNVVAGWRQPAKLVMAGLKREARLRADVPGIHVLTAYCDCGRLRVSISFRICRRMFLLVRDSWRHHQPSAFIFSAAATKRFVTSAKSASV